MSVKKPKPDTFAARLQSIRESKNMTREDLGDAIGSSRQRVHQLETGSHRPTWAEVQAIADTLGVTTDTFRDS